MNEPQIFVDMDGVLADFDRHYNDVFGIEANKHLDNVDWSLVRRHPDFYLNIPPMPDMEALWDYIAHRNPIVLTGIPASVREAASNKCGWVSKVIGDHVEVRCCLSREKSLHAKPGDILIDDWERYMEKWQNVGGIWITHTSAADTIIQLKAMGL